MRKHAPTSAAVLAAPARAEAITAAEAELGMTFPADLIAAVVDGFTVYQGGAEPWWHERWLPYADADGDIQVAWLNTRQNGWPAGSSNTRNRRLLG
jgi:hypothetical protein